MKYAVISCTNGTFKVESEHGKNLQGAIVAFHQICAAFWNTSDVETAKVNVVDGKSEFISHIEPEEA